MQSMMNFLSTDSNPPPTLFPACRVALLALVLSLVWQPVHPVTGSREPVFELISPESGFVFNAITTIATDRSGFVWFGTNEGLYFYNNKEYRRYYFEPDNPCSPPSNRINKLYCDSGGKIWVCTDDGACYFERDLNSFTRVELKLPIQDITAIAECEPGIFLLCINGSLYVYNPQDASLFEVVLKDADIHAKVSCIEKCPTGEIFIGCTDGRVFRQQSSPFDFHKICTGINETIKCLCLARGGEAGGQGGERLLVGYDRSGVDVFSMEGELLQRYSAAVENSLPNDRIRKIVQRRSGEVWIATYDGILVVAPNGQTRTIKSSRYNRLPRNSIYELHLCGNDAMWVGTWAGGLAYYHDLNYRFHQIDDTYTYTEVQHGVISSFAEHSRDEVLVGSEETGLNLFNLRTGTYSLHKPPFHQRIKAMSWDPQGLLWIGTVGFGLYNYDERSGKVTHVGIDIIDRNSHAPITSITFDGDDIWLGTHELGLVRHNRKTGQTRLFPPGDTDKDLKSNMIWGVMDTPKQKLIVCTENGLSIFDKKTEAFHTIFHTPGLKGANHFYFICEEQRGEYYVGTRDNGIYIYNLNTDTLTPFPLNDQLKHTDVYSILNGGDSIFWFSTNWGIYLYDKKANTLKHFSPSDGLRGNQYHPMAGLIASSGNVLFGNTTGFSYIDPGSVAVNGEQSRAYPFEILVNNQPLEQLKKVVCNTKYIPEISLIKLPYNLNTISLEFSANNFLKSANNRLRYKLTNYQKEWTEIPASRDITYTKIPPGKYELVVYSINNDGVAGDEATKIRIVVRQPLWLAWYAILLYLGIASLAAYLVYKELRFRAKAKQDLKLERYKNAMNEATAVEKMKFFMNVSHEFRTPLTLIASPLKMLEQSNLSAAEVKSHLATIHRNTDRLLRLVNQVLDFRMLEVGKKRMNPQMVDAVELCKLAYECFDYNIVENRIKFVFNAGAGRILATADPDMIEKIIYNLLSNAIKFSGDEPHIVLSVGASASAAIPGPEYYMTGVAFDSPALEISVSDNGPGIPEGQLPRIFDRFVFGEKDPNRGSGIGLHLCREYVEMHGGYILVKTRAGEGTEFIVRIPLEGPLPEESPTSSVEPYRGAADPAPDSPGGGVNPQTILIVEDHDEIRRYLKTLLGRHYHCVTAKNGLQGLEMARSVNPDLIISDIRMPGMSGLELVEKLRSDGRTALTPIIVITALTDDITELRSISAGVDAFLHKPINETILMAHIQRLLAHRGQPEMLPERADHKLFFMDKVDHLIETNLQNATFDVASLTKALGVNRSSLYRRITAETGMSMSEYIRDYRLKMAAGLMKKGVYNIDELAICVGFNSTSYFCRAFKTKYGMTPKEYRKTNLE